MTNTWIQDLIIFFLLFLLMIIYLVWYFKLVSYVNYFTNILF